MNKWVRKAKQAASGEAGFTIVETIMAMIVFLLIFVALLTTTIAGFTALRQTRFVQQATGLANEAIEAARDLPYDSIIMVSTDATWTGDTHVTTTCGPNFSGTRSLDPDGSASLACEPIVQGTTGSFNPHRTTNTINGKQFTVNRYVTWVDDATQGGVGQSYKRFSVIVQWEHNGTKTYRASTLISEARRGPPDSEFTLSPSSQSRGYTLEAGGTSSFSWFAHTISNYGVADTYELSIEEFDEDDPGLEPPWSYTIYEDTGDIGDFDGEGFAEELDDTDGNGLIDTGSVAAAPTTTTPTEFHFIVVVTYGAEDPLSKDFTLKAASRLNPEVTNSATDEAIGNLILYLHNRTTGTGSPNSNTTASGNMLMSESPSTTSTLYNYSTNLLSGRTGRYVAVVASASALASPAGPSFIAINWTYQVPGPNDVTLSGEPVNLRIWWTTPSCGGVFRVNAFLNHKATRTTSSSSQVTQISSATQNVTTTASCNYEEPLQKLSLDIPVTAGTVIPDNRWIEIKVQITDNNTSDMISPSPALFMYDTSNSTCSGVVLEICYRSRLRVPQM